MGRGVVTDRIQGASTEFTLPQHRFTDSEAKASETVLWRHVAERWGTKHAAREHQRARKEFVMGYGLVGLIVTIILVVLLLRLLGVWI
jgi:hypothetical protein